MVKKHVKTTKEKKGGIIYKRKFYTHFKFKIIGKKKKKRKKKIK